MRLRNPRSCRQNCGSRRCFRRQTLQRQEVLHPQCRLLPEAAPADATSLPLDLDACALQDRLHVWMAVARLSTWDAPVAQHCPFCLPSGLSIRVRPVCPASILLETDRVAEVVADRFSNDHCLPTPLSRCRRQLAALTAILLGDLSGIEVISTKGSPALDASLGRPLPYLQVALAAAGPGRQVRQRWGHQGCPS